MDHPPGRSLLALSRFVDRHARWFVGGWIAVVVALTLAVPSLETVAERDASAFLPPDAPSAQAEQALNKAFDTGGGEAAIFVVMSDDNGLSKADLAYYDSLVRRVEADHTDVDSVTSFTDNPALRDAFVSKDGKAAYFVAALPAATGSPAALAQIDAVRSLSRIGKPDSLQVHVTGPTATVGDMTYSLNQSMGRVTLATLGLITLILLLIYRSPSPIAVALTTLGVTLGAARGVVALAGDLGVLHVSTFTGAFMTGVVLGAGTDYAVFQISRYQEMRRAGRDAAEAVPAALSRVNGVIAGSALTVIVATMSMVLAKLGLFTTTGPGIALGILVALLISLTFTPALMALVVKRGWLEPRPSPRSERRWARTAALVVGRPARVLLAGVAVLGLLAAFYPHMVPNYDQRSTQPATTDSNLGYAALSDHFPLNELLPDYVVVSADHDLRNADDLAALEGVAIAIAKIPDVVEVRGITRPLGKPITQASVAYQAGQVGKKLGRADKKLAAGVAGADQLASGAARVAGGATDLAGGAQAAVDGTGRLLDGLQQQFAGLKDAAAGASSAHSGAANLRSGAQQLAEGLDLAADQTKTAVAGMQLVLQALDASTGCSVDPTCVQARSGLRQIYDGERNQLLPGLRQAAQAAHDIADGSRHLAGGLSDLAGGLDRARDGMARLRDGQASLHQQLGRLADGSQQVADGAQQVGDGTHQISGSVRVLRAQLSQAARFLQRTGRAASSSAVGGFYLPAKALDNPRLALAGSYYLSPDGHTARFIVLGREDSFSNPARERSRAVDAAARDALIGTPLSGAVVGTTGIAASNEDIHLMSGQDFTLISAVALIAVFLILMWLLRSPVAAVMLIGSVLLSFLAAMGLSVLFWQVLLGHDIDWTVTSTAFIILVAVGSDYNLLMMKRMKDEAPHAERPGISRAVASTGGVITTAGLIFAASMFAMLFSPLIGIKEVGFTIGMGLLLDTFVVRSMVVPAAATLLGRLLWWPGHPGGDSAPPADLSARRAQRSAVNRFWARA